MSRDIRSYFLPKASNKNDTKPASNQGNTQKSQKKRTIILDSDSDEEVSKPQAKKVKEADIPRTASKENGKKAVKKDLKPVNPEEVFGKQKIKRSTEKTVPELKNKVKEETKDEDKTFAAVLEQLDKQEKISPLELVDTAASHKLKESKVSPSKDEKTAKKTKSAVNNSELGATVPIKKVKTEEVKSSASKEAKITTEHKTVTSHSKEEKPNKAPEERDKKDKSKKISPSKTSPIKSTEAHHVKEEIIKKESVKKWNVSCASVEDSSADESFTIDPLEKKRQHAIHYQKYLQRQGPKNPGAKEIPKGKPGCLLGKVFVITGVLESLEREEAATLIQQYGGKVTGSISRNTSFVVVGEDPGPSKMEKAAKLNIKQLTEDGLLELIASSPSKEDISTIDAKGKSKKSDKDESSKKSKYWKKESEKENKTNSILEIKTEAPVETKINIAPEKPSSSSSVSFGKPVSASPEYRKSTPDSALWVDKYKPTSLKQIIGQQGDRSNAKKLLKWLENWHVNHSGKKKASRPSPWAKDDNGAFFKAALLSGPPGVGKTTTAHLVCKELGYDVVEFNASDTRSKKLLHEEVTELLSSKSLYGYFQGGAGKKPNNKHALLMDEVDGMAGNEDRGGIQELIQLIKSSRVPIICMCNDRSHPKIRSLTNYCFDLTFSKPRVEQIRGAMMSICFKEGVKISGEALNDVINGANQDIRQVLHHLSLWSAKDKQLSAEQAKEDSQKSKKYIKLGPWDVVRKVFSAEAHKSMSLKDKSDLFFHDYSLGPLFVQQNYVIANPHKAKGNKHKQLMLLSEAADSISMGNVVEQTIRSKNAWSLLPVQAVFSSVLPGEAMEGHLTAQINFPAWLGKNSRRNKFHRLVQELQVHMRLATLASKQAINLDYLQHIRDRIVQPLITKGIDGVPDTLGTMKTYSLLREDIDSIMELTLWPGQKDPMSLVDSKVKAALTRTYNKEGIMTPYSVATSIKKRLGSSIEELDPEQDQVEDEEEQDDISSDAMIKAKKRPAASRNTEAGGSETKKRKGKDKEEKEKNGKQKNKKKQK